MTDSPSSSIVVLRLSAFGDVVHTLPAVAALRASLPATVEIGWVVERAFRDLVQLVAPVERVFIADTRRWRRSPREGARELALLHKDLRAFAEGATSVDFQGLLKSAILGELAGAATRYGFGPNSVREKASLFFTNRRVEVDPSLHVVDWNLALARAAGATMSPPVLDFSRFEEDSSGKLAPLVHLNTVVINPGAGHPSKIWPVDSFVQLVREIRQQKKAEPLIIWGPDEHELAEEIGSRSGAFVAPSTTFRELAWILRRARLMISGDTGPIHLAAAIGIPVIGLYGPTNPQRNGPFGQLDHVVESYSTTRDMSSISVNNVLAMVERVHHSDQ